jgi:hypothetical protein
VGEQSEWLPEVYRPLREAEGDAQPTQVITQLVGVVHMYIESISSYSAGLSCFSSSKIRGAAAPFDKQPSTKVLDDIVYKAATECLGRFKTHFDHKAIHLPATLHGLGIMRVADAQHVLTCTEVLSHLNSLDLQVRATTRAVFHQLWARGLKGRRIGYGIGYFLKLLSCDSDEDGRFLTSVGLCRDGEPLAHLAFLIGPEPDISQRELPTCWLNKRYWRPNPADVANETGELRKGEAPMDPDDYCDPCFAGRDISWLCTNYFDATTLTSDKSKLFMATL